MARKLRGRESAEILGEVVGEGKDNIRRYIRLTELIPEILEMVDQEEIALRPAVELSYLPVGIQKSYIKSWIWSNVLSHAQTLRMRRLFENRKLNDQALYNIMREESRIRKRGGLF